MSTGTVGVPGVTAPTGERAPPGYYSDAPRPPTKRRGGRPLRRPGVPRGRDPIGRTHGFRWDPRLGGSLLDSTPRPEKGYAAGTRPQERGP